MSDILYKGLAFIGVVALWILMSVAIWFVVGYLILYLGTDILHWDLDMNLFHTVWLVALGWGVLYASSKAKKDD